MARIQFRDDIAVYNTQTDTWECQNPTVAELLQTVLEYQARSVNECMHLCATRYGATILEWLSEQPSLEVAS